MTPPVERQGQPDTTPRIQPTAGAGDGGAMRTARGVVLLTGASSGIGLVTTLTLARAGFHVIATVRTQSSADALVAQAPPGSVTPTYLDLADPLQADETARVVGGLLRDAGVPGLAGLVNNAGFGVVGPTETVALDRIRQQFEVNVFGQLALTRAVLPLLRAGRGRIVNIGSVGAWVTMPFVGPLSASKAALRAFNDALRLELKPSGVAVVLLEPGRVRSAAAGHLVADIEPTIAAMSAEQRERYGAAYRGVVTKAARMEQNGEAPEPVARAVVKALTAARPRSRTPIGKTARILGLFAKLLPNPLFDRMRYKAFGLAGFARGAGSQ
jgi:NAD(P)-dependent dehydrogenase (short-subunit alcohol dehydrogenase family)